MPASQSTYLNNSQAHKIKQIMEKSNNTFIHQE